MEYFKKLPVKTYFLELKKPFYDKHELPDNFHVQKLTNPDTEFYLSIYRQISEPWGWAGRLMMTKNELETKIQDPDNNIYVLEDEGKLAGFAEFERQDRDIEIVYFGLDKDYIGKKIGKAWFIKILDSAWEQSPRKIWLHTCELDHPSALSFYQKLGLKIFNEKILQENYTIDFLKKRGLVEKKF